MTLVHDVCVLVCMFVYIHSKCVSCFKETDRSKPDWKTPAELKVDLKREPVCMWCDQDLNASVAVFRMCQRVCLLPCLASVKAVYIGPDGGGNSAQLSSSPRLHTEQWTEAAATARTAEKQKTRATGAASCCYCMVRLFQFSIHTNQT